MPLISCPDCSTQVSDKAASCPKCGHPIATTSAPAPSMAMSMTSKDPGVETSYYTDDRGIRITNARAIIASKTYSMSNISSVSMGRIPASYGAAVLMMVVGAGGAFAGFNADSAGVGVFMAMFLISGIIIAMTLKDEWTVRITAASGEADALKSKDKDHIQAIVAAINEAIVGRG